MLDFSIPSDYKDIWLVGSILNPNLKIMIYNKKSKKQLINYSDNYALVKYYFFLAEVS